jgi:hypothetical protein
MMMDRAQMRRTVGMALVVVLGASSGAHAVDHAEQIPQLPPPPVGSRSPAPSILDALPADAPPPLPPKEGVTEPAVPVPLPQLQPGPTPVVTIERRRRINLIIAGVSTLLASYAADRLLARDLSQSPVSWVPLVGPWWILKEESSRPSPSQALQALLVVDGLVQLSGLALAITGTFLRYDRVVLRLPRTQVGPLPTTTTVLP